MVSVDGTAQEAAALTRFSQELLTSLPRADQRRWGGVYVRGLVEVPGRRSIPRIADRLGGGCSEQSLQQFVNQSPWAWQPVLRSLTGRWLLSAPARAWVIEELAIRKHGSSSVGVDLQFVPALQRDLRCQLALAAFVVGDGAAGPVNWRLQLPASWDRDRCRRLRAGVPDGEVHRTRWQHTLDLLDELLRDWSAPPRPVVVDARHGGDPECLLRGLEARRLRYLVRVHPPAVPRSVAAARPPRGVAGRPPAARRLLVLPGPPVTRAWITNLGGTRAEVLPLVETGRRAREAALTLYRDHGLDHFEGRSYRGWHHHVTLVSIAHAFRALAQPVPGRWQRSGQPVSV